MLEEMTSRGDAAAAAPWDASSMRGRASSAGPAAARRRAAGGAEAVGESGPAPAATTVRFDTLPPRAPWSASARAAGQAGVARHAAASAPAMATVIVT